MKLWIGWCGWSRSTQKLEFVGYFGIDKFNISKLELGYNHPPGSLCGVYSPT